MSRGTFATVINCMDGRTQEAALRFLRPRFGVDWVDSVTEPGPIRILAERGPAAVLENIRTRLRISVESHKSRAIAVVSHEGCEGNPADREIQAIQLRKSLEVVRGWFPSAEVIGLWVAPVHGVWVAEEICC